MSDSLQLRHLRFIVAIADEGSFSRAADRLDLRQSHVSRTIKMLEEQLGFQIFLRKQWTTISPTPAGILLVEYARDAIHEHEEVLHQVRELGQDSETNDVAIGLANSPDSV